MCFANATIHCALVKFPVNNLTVRHIFNWYNWVLHLPQRGYLHIPKNMLKALASCKKPLVLYQKQAVDTTAKLSELFPELSTNSWASLG